MCPAALQAWGSQNQSDRYAIHQESARIGNVAATAHQKGSVKSATSPKPAKVSQNIFFCMFPAYFESQPMPFRVRNRYLANKKSGAMPIAPLSVFSVLLLV